MLTRRLLPVESPGFCHCVPTRCGVKWVTRPFVFGIKPATLWSGKHYFSETRNWSLIFRRRWRHPKWQKFPAKGISSVPRGEGFKYRIAMSSPRFIHLRVHTEYSLLEGAVPVKKLIGLCADQAMPAVAVTDTNNMFAALEFSVLAKEKGVQPIVGCQISVAAEPVKPGEKPRDPAPIVLLAQNNAGYMNLMKLNSALYIDKGGQLPQVTVEELATYAEGLICLTGGADGPVGRFLQTGQAAKAQALMERLAEIYPERLYVELQRHPGPGNRLPEAESANRARLSRDGLCDGSAVGRDQ